MPSKLFDLSDRTCLVTGSARGLGNALAAGLAEAGATVVVTEMTTEISAFFVFNMLCSQRYETTH
jgi:NAD(P)-dependent dehydrogenase (short-subunit alcohol dehydrogenase family)